MGIGALAHRSELESFDLPCGHFRLVIDQHDRAGRSW